jgi:hypothetical protein
MAAVLQVAALSAAVVAATVAPPAPTRPGAATVLGYGFTASGRAFSLATSGEVSFLSEDATAAVQPSVVAASACAVGPFAPSSGMTRQAGASNLTLFGLTRGNTSAATVHIVGVDVATGATVVRDELPFSGGDAAEDFALGYDFYMDQCAACALDAPRRRSRGGIETTTTARLVVTGPDEIQFIHMVTVEPAVGKAHYNDLLQCVFPTAGVLHFLDRLPLLSCSYCSVWTGRRGNVVRCALRLLHANINPAISGTAGDTGSPAAPRLSTPAAARSGSRSCAWGWGGGAHAFVAPVISTRACCRVWGVRRIRHRRSRRIQHNALRQHARVVFGHGCLPLSREDKRQGTNCRGRRRAVWPLVP